MKVREGATGELIVAGNDLEAHVYLQSGRVAWAYNNQERGLFLRELMQLTGLGEDDLSDVLDECRSSRRHVAETLLEYGLAQEPDIRRALWAQLTATLRTIGAEQETEAIFLKRQSTHYDERLTFTLEDFSHSRFSSLPPDGDHELVARENRLHLNLSKALPATLWVKLVRRPNGQSNRASSPDVLRIVIECLYTSGAIECIYRDVTGWLFAVQNADGYLCCGFPPGVLMSKARKTLLEQAGAQATSGEPQKLALGPGHGPPSHPLLEHLMPLLEQFDFVAALHVVTDEGFFSVLKENAPQGIDRHIQNASTILRLPLGERIQSSSAVPLSRLPSQTPALRMALEQMHVLGMPLSPSVSVWLSICPTVPEGIGWGLLTNMQRLLAPQPFQ